MEGDYPSNWVLDERVPVGHAYAAARERWSNPLLEELRERRAAEVAGSGLKWPTLDDGTLMGYNQYQYIMHQWMQDTIMIQDGELYHSRWGYGYTAEEYARAARTIPPDRRPTGDLPDKRSGARYWPIGRV